VRIGRYTTISATFRRSHQAGIKGASYGRSEPSRRRTMHLFRRFGCLAQSPPASIIELGTSRGLAHIPASASLDVAAARSSMAATAANRGRAFAK
jgi:hypothetical protein